MIRPLIALGVLALAASEASADPCPPAVDLSGDANLVESVGAELRKRGIATTGSCDGRQAIVSRDGDDVVVDIDSASRSVRGVGTAAAVIESFVREEVSSPLLAARRAPVLSAPERPDVLVVVAERERPSGWHFTAIGEATIANDGSGWGGMAFGACRMIGPLCPGVRLRGSMVTGDDPNDGMYRKASDLLVGLDVPFTIGRFLVMPGVAGGIGGMTTNNRAMDDGGSWYPSTSNNLRAQVHASVSVPLTRTLALDVMVAGTLGQQVAREPGYMDAVPAEPFAFLRFGVGLRYGSR